MRSSLLLQIHIFFCPMVIPQDEIVKINHDARIRTKTGSTERTLGTLQRQPGVVKQ
jgi:hypothetical protein